MHSLPANTTPTHSPSPQGQLCEAEFCPAQGFSGQFGCIYGKSFLIRRCKSTIKPQIINGRRSWNKDERSTAGVFLILCTLIVLFFFPSFFSALVDCLPPSRHMAPSRVGLWGLLVRFGPVAASQCGEKAGSCFIEKYLPCYLPSTIIT